MKMFPCSSFRYDHMRRSRSLRMIVCSLPSQSLGLGPTESACHSGDVQTAPFITSCWEQRFPL